MFRMLLNKFIIIEGLDKDFNASFIESFERNYNNLEGLNKNILKIYSFPNINNPIGLSIINEQKLTNPNNDILNLINYLTEMSWFWANEMYQNQQNIVKNLNSDSIQNDKKQNIINYIINSYYITTIAMEAYYVDSRSNLEFIKFYINNHSSLKTPTDLIFLDIPTQKLIEKNLNDDNSMEVDVDKINKKRECYYKALDFLKPLGIKYHIIEDITKYNIEQLCNLMIGNIF